MAECVMLSMEVTLVAARPVRFSETARPRPRHGEAVGDVVRDPPPAVAGGRFADDGAERPAERPEAGEADVEADVGHAAVGLHEQEHRPLDAPALQVAMRRLAEGGPEGADEVRLGDVGDPREGGDVEGPGVAAVHRVAGAQQSAVGVLDGPAHGVVDATPRGGPPRLMVMEPAVVDVAFEERYWYPHDGGVVWVSGYQLVDRESGRFLARDAPEVVGAGLIVVSVAGAARHHAQALADEHAVAPGRPLTLRRDPGNEHDPNAIAVHPECG